MQELTIAIVAYNAEETIARAVKSVMAAGSYPILLVDDGSVDATVSVAKAVAGEQITVFSQRQNKGVGAARARALQEITTPYGMWLDADDEILPDRPLAMVAALTTGADLAYDGGFLVTEMGEKIKQLDVPNFMLERGAELRCFERNWFPILAGAFNVDFARHVGFDVNFECVEDYDFLLRAVASGANVQALDTTGYKYIHGGSSISRNIGKTRAYVNRALGKHPYEAVEVLLEKSVLSCSEQGCILAGMALYRHDPEKALQYATELNRRDDPIHPYGMTAGLYADFIAASAHVADDNWAAANRLLDTAVRAQPSADVWNNLGVTLHRLGNHVAAQNAFKEALLLLPGYHDAQRNIEAGEPSCWTTHPMRRQSSRDDYSG